ncbi:MAG: 5'-nucleotidase C-terminal domain-containing protein [Flavobacteriaceae bacterium]
MRLRIKHFVVFITIISVLSCRERVYHLSEIKGAQLPIEHTKAKTELDSIDAFVAPYRNHVNSVLDAPLSYAPKTITSNDGRYNSSAGNLLADIVMEQANPVFKSRTNRDIDFVVLNHGGIRSVISAGDISSRTAYEVMPFENMIVIIEMKGKSIRDLVSHLVRSNRPHPISGLQIVIGHNDQLVSVSIQGRPFDETRSYYVATSDYLFSGGDDMKFFKEGLEHTEIQYLMRNAMIDYFKKKDTVLAAVDDRFIKLDSL